MARADSSVRVNIIGDAKSLQQAASSSEKAVGGLGKAAKGVAVAMGGLFAADKLLDFTQSALSEADRLGDATARLEASLGGLAQPLIDAAGGMENLGQSRQDVLELEARFTDLATAAHLSNTEIAQAAPKATEAAAALALLGIGGGDAATVLDLIGKAAGGSDKPLKELGVNLSDAQVEARAMADTGKTNADALTDQELAAARLALIMEALQPKIVAVTDGEADLEQRQTTLQARFETFTGKVGDAVDGPLTDLLGLLILIGDQAGAAGGQFAALDTKLDGMTGAFGDAANAARDLLNVLAQISRFLPNSGALQLGTQVFGTSGGNSGQGSPVVVQVQGGSPEVIEQAVQRAIVSLGGRQP